MSIYYYIFIFVIGLSLGSFFNVVIFRFNSGKGVVKGRSECLNCGSVIKWYDLIPILSYIFLAGKCRDCKKNISPLYPVVEISTASILLLFFFNAPMISPLTWINAFIIAVFTLIIFFDLIYFIIPDKALYLIAIAIIGSKLLIYKNTAFETMVSDLYSLLISALGLTLFFAILFLVSKGRWIGLGDIKLIFIIGLLLGYPLGYLSVISSVWIAAIFSIALLISGKATAKTEIPFGSFLSVTAIFFIIFNNELWEITRYFF